MKTIVIANQKGGSGKSTTVVHLSVAAEHAGDGPVVVTDTDPQGSAADWHNQRKASGITTPRYANLGMNDLREKQAAFAEAGAKLLIIDTAPSIGAVNAELFQLADMILVPLNPSPADLRALVKMIPLLRESRTPFHFILSRVRANVKSTGSTALALHALGLVVGTRMHERLIYSETFGHGRTALEIEPDGIASNELRSLWADVKAMIQ